MIFFVTYNDQPSGVYWSQVTDVVDHLNSRSSGDVRLVAMVSLRNFMQTRREIRARLPNALVVPMVPRAHNWRINWIWLELLCRRYRPTGIIGRGIFATALGIRMRERGLVQQVCFDARAAYGSEWEEFRVVDNDRLIAECARLEKEVVHMADVRMSVSQALVDHWCQHFGYRGERHVVIPCTLGRQVEARNGNGNAGVRAQFGWGADDVVLAYSGTVVGWQSLERIRAVVSPWLAAAPDRRILFLSEAHPVIDHLAAEHPGQVSRSWVQHSEVRSMLLDCDFGLLLRDPCVTNRVASPTKFAEYLSAGLSVVISPDVGDFSAMVAREEIGVVVGPDASLVLEKPDQQQRQRLARIARERFTKEAYDAHYGTILSHLGPVAKEWRPIEPHAVDVPVVSLIVPSYNKRTFIGNMIASVCAQTDPRWELLVVDDASTDGSQILLAQLASTDPRIRLIQLPENRGANHCRNVGIAEAKGEYIVFVDADDLLAPQCVEQRLRTMLGSGLDLAVFTLEVFRTKPGDDGYQWIPDTPTPLHDFFRHKLPWQTMQPIWDRRFLNELGGFDEAFSRHQDVELHTRALLQERVHFRYWHTAPDCYYRIAEERKVIDPVRLLTRFCESAVMYREKFADAAAQRGCPDLLLGIIYRTYLQVLLHVKDQRITMEQLGRLEAVLFTPEWYGTTTSSKRFLFKLTRWYNLKAVRIPGVSFVLFSLITSSWKR